jgi:hypothetical protein
MIEVISIDNIRAKTKSKEAKAAATINRSAGNR